MTVLALGKRKTSNSKDKSGSLRDDKQKSNCKSKSWPGKFVHSHLRRLTTPASKCARRGPRSAAPKMGHPDFCGWLRKDNDYTKNNDNNNNDKNNDNNGNGKSNRLAV